MSHRMKKSSRERSKKITFQDHREFLSQSFAVGKRKKRRALKSSNEIKISNVYQG